MCLIEQGDIQPLLARSFALESLSEAQAFFLDKQFTGKLVIDMSLEWIFDDLLSSSIRAGVVS